jgi:predicted glycosyltransferase involved in capsule biosynthesis
MNDVTLILPIFNLTNHRLRNFEALLAPLGKLDIPIIVVEQNSSNLMATNLPENMQHILFKPTNGLFQKSRMINFAVEKIRTKYLWMLDADTYFDYQRMLDLLDDQDAAHPFDRIIILTEEETQRFLLEKKIAFKKGDNRHWMIPFGPHTFAVKRSIFEAVGRMDDRYEGYGWEDLEFAWRIVTHYKVTCFHLPALHLHHAKSSTNPSNTAVFKSSGADIDQLIEASKSESGPEHFRGGIEKRELKKKPCLQPIPWLEGVQ